MPELGTSGSVRGRDGQPPGLLDRVFTGKANSTAKGETRFRYCFVCDFCGLELTNGDAYVVHTGTETTAQLMHTACVTFWDHSWSESQKGSVSIELVSFVKLLKFVL